MTVILATAWFFFTAIWGIDQIPGSGHLGSSGAATAMFGENMVRWHTFYALWDWHSLTRPPLSSAYCHHPYGVHWAQAICALFFFHRNFDIALPAVVFSTLTPPLLYGIGRRIGGPLAGAAAAVGFVILPLTIGYSCFASLEVMTIFGAALYYWGHLRYQETSRRRDLALMLLGVLVATFGDWAGYLLIAPVLVWTFARTFVLPAWATPIGRFRTDARAWAWSASVAVFTAAVTIGMFKHADGLSSWLSSAQDRGAGSDQPLSTVLEARKAWIDFSFTPIAIAIGKLALPVGVIRASIKRRDVEMMPLAALFGAAAQYLVFKQGADVHIFWPHYFGLYFALGLAQLVASVDDVVRAVVRRFSPTEAVAAGAVAAMTVIAVSTLLILPDGARSLRIWRETGGKYDDKGSRYQSAGDLNWLLVNAVRPYLHRGDVVGFHPSAAAFWEQEWAIAATPTTSAKPDPKEAFWVGRANSIGADGLRDLASKHHVRVYGDVVLVRPSEPPAPLDAFLVQEREPGPLEWLLTNATEPVRSLSPQPDPFLTWEWRYHLGQDATPPTVAPVTLDQKRIAHNVAVAAGDTGRAAKLEQEVLDSIDRSPEAHFTGGHVLIGMRITHGVKSMLHLYFSSGGPTPGAAMFTVHATVRKKARFSSIPADPNVMDLAYPPSIPTRLWKQGFIYRLDVELKHRIGEEVLSGAWASLDGRAAPAPLHGPEQVDLAVLR